MPDLLRQRGVAALTVVAALSMSMLDDGAPRPDLSARQESKYVFTTRDVGTLRQVLLRRCRPIVYAGRVSTVRSLYFDDAALSTCRASVDGVGIRWKVRLRWYDSKWPTDHVFFELKWRRHRVTGKHRLRLACHEPLEAAPLGTIRSGLLHVLPPRFADVLACTTETVSLVEYRREHFAVQDTSARLTLDYDLRFYPQIGRRRPAQRFAERLPDVALIECKTGVGDNAALQGVLGPLRARPMRFSKYVAACQRLGYVPET